MPGGEVIEGAGGVVWRAAAVGAEVALVHRPFRNDWTLPIGRLERGESPEACALREVAEETGQRCELGDRLGTVEVVGADDGDLHRWHLYLMRAVDGTFVPNQETDEVAWLDVASAAERVTYDNFRGLLLVLEARLRQLALGAARAATDYRQ